MDDFAGVRAVHYIANDPGLAWSKDPEVSIAMDTPLDNLSVLTPNVVRLPDGGYRMYYTGLGDARPEESSNGYILSAFSKDGLNWVNDPGIRVGKPPSSRIDARPLPGRDPSGGRPLAYVLRSPVRRRTDCRVERGFGRRARMGPGRRRQSLRSRMVVRNASMPLSRCGRGRS